MSSGGALLTPIVLLCGADIAVAGGLSSTTMLVAFARRDSTYTLLRADLRFVVAMTARSILGGLLLGLISASVTPLQVLLLIASALKVWRALTSR